MSEENGFLARWSQRKRQALEETRKAPAPEADAPPTPAEEPDFDLSLLPDLDALTPETDISLFLRKGVPDALRNAALRKIWALDPAIRDHVGDALDYAWDWNAPGGVPGGGDLPPGFDSREMVARIFGDPPADKNVIEHVAPQQSVPQMAGMETEMLPASSQAEANQAEVPAKSRSDEQPGLIQHDAALHKRKRHGSAAPDLSGGSHLKV